MIIETFVVTPFQQNARIVACEKTRRAICLDPGETTTEILNFVAANDLQIQAVTLTHAHLDHIGGVTDFSARFPQAEIILHRDDQQLYERLPEQPLAMGVPRAQLEMLGMNYAVPPPINRFWTDEEIYQVGELNFEVLHCPGHTPGHVIFFERESRAAFVGDCLFQGSIGRTDLPGGDTQSLLDSIKTRILPLGDDVSVYSGHGADTLIGIEKRTNPFLINL